MTWRLSSASLPTSEIPYVRTPEFLSPTALAVFEEFPIQYYFNYLGPPELKPKRFQQTSAMAYGSAFDGEVKLRLAHECNVALRAKKDGTVRSKDFFRKADYGLLKFLDRHHKKDAALRQRALLIVDGYWNGPPAEDVRRHGAELLEDDPQIVRLNGVPLYGKIDLKTGEPRIVDFKVTGSCSKNPISPVPGYSAGWVWDPRTGEYKQKKARSKVGQPLEILKPEWAAQLGTYHFIDGGTADQDAKVGIDQVTFLSKDRICYTQVRTHITKEFLQGLALRYVAAWTAIKDRKVIPEKYRNKSIRFLQMMTDQHA